MELAVVISIILVVLAVSFPKLLPLIAFGEHEGAARHLASYGRSAMGQAALLGDHYTIHVDLDEQEYWTMRWPKPSELAEEEGAGEEMFSRGLKDADEVPEDAYKSSEELLSSFMMAEAGEADDATDLDYEAELMEFRFDEFQRQKTLALAEHAKHDDGMLKDVGIDFSDDGLVQDADAELEPVELEGSLLNRVRLPDNVYIESIRVGDEELRQGEVEIDITATGMAESVTFFVVDGEGDYFTVKWDAVTAGAQLKRGLEK